MMKKNTKKHFFLGLLAALFISGAAYAYIPSSNEIKFDAFRNGKDFGTHTLSFSKDGDKTVVDIKIDLKVNLAFIPVFKYSHTNREVWQGGKLISLETKTNDNGDKHVVSAVREGDTLKVTPSVGEPYEVSAKTMTTSYWQKRTMTQEQLINTQTGELINVSIESLGSEEYGGLPGERFKITGDLKTEIVYHRETAQWIGLRFQAKGSDITYSLTEKQE